MRDSGNTQSWIEVLRFLVEKSRDVPVVGTDGPLVFGDEHPLDSGVSDRAFEGTLLLGGPECSIAGSREHAILFRAFATFDGDLRPRTLDVLTRGLDPYRPATSLDTPFAFAVTEAPSTSVTVRFLAAGSVSLLGTDPPLHPGREKIRWHWGTRMGSPAKH